MRTTTLLRSERPLAGMVTALQMALTIGAAREVANTAQRARIDSDVMSAMLNPLWLLEADPSGVYAALTDVMGAAWAPSGVWKQQLAVLS